MNTYDRICDTCSKDLFTLITGGSLKLSRPECVRDKSCIKLLKEYVTKSSKDHQEYRIKQEEEGSIVKVN